MVTDFNGPKANLPLSSADKLANGASKPPNIFYLLPVSGAVNLGL